jgi:hypothetical protein
MMIGKTWLHNIKKKHEQIILFELRKFYIRFLNRTLVSIFLLKEKGIYLINYSIHL